MWKQLQVWLGLLGAAGNARPPEYRIVYHHPFQMMLTPEGIFLLKGARFEAVRNEALSESEVGEYARLSIGTRIATAKAQMAAQDDRRYSELQRRVCCQFLANLDKLMRSEIAEYGAPVRLERRSFYGAETPAGLELLASVISLSWSRYGRTRVEKIRGPISGFLVTVARGRQLLLPSGEIDRITIYPRHAAVSYQSGPTIQVELLSPDWREGL